MEIIQNNYDKCMPDAKLVYKVTCEHCGSVLKVNDDDLFPRETGILYYRCPCCLKESATDSVGDRLTYQKLKFPDNWFIHAQTEQDKEILSDSQKYLEKAIKTLYENLKFVEIPLDSENEISQRYYTGRTILFMTKFRNEDNEYEYDLEIVKLLCSTNIYDEYERVRYDKGE